MLLFYKISPLVKVQNTVQKSINKSAKSKNNKHKCIQECIAAILHFIFEGTQEGTTNEEEGGTRYPGLSSLAAVVYWQAEWT